MKIYFIVCTEYKQVNQYATVYTKTLEVHQQQCILTHLYPHINQIEQGKMVTRIKNIKFWQEDCHPMERDM